MTPIAPGPTYNFLQMMQLIPRIDHDPLAVMRDWAATYGDIVRVQFGKTQMFFIHHPEHIRQALVEQGDKFIKDYQYKHPENGLARFLGNGLLVSDGEFWKRQRKLVQPALHFKRIANYADIMTDFTVKMLENWTPNKVIDVDQEMMRLTLNIVGKSLFDADVSSDSQRFGYAITVLQHTSGRPSKLPKWIPTPRRYRENKAVTDLDDIMYRIIRERRASGEDHGDLLSMLLMAVEAVTLFLAGHETTSNSLTWTFYLLSQHPEIEAKLHEELDNVLGGRVPTLDDLKQLKYTEMVVKESLRLYPPAYGFSREATDEVTIGDYTLPKRAGLSVMSFIAHRDPRWWDAPNEFIPERFSPENEKNHTKYAYIPFGTGQRICVGSMFAMMEAQLILATVAQQYQLSLVPGHKVEPEALITMRARYGMRMIPKLRQPVRVLEKA
jgi:cytochrome P450